MKQLPDYLEKIVDHLATCEEKTGGLRKAAAHEKFKKELISESLTAKANPETSANPTIKKFHEIEELLYAEFQASPLGKAMKSSDRMKFFDNLRNFAVDMAEKIITGDFINGRVKRGGQNVINIFGQWNDGRNMHFDNYKKTNTNKASLEYPVGGLKGLSKGEKQDVMAEVEGYRYLRLMTSTIVVGLLRPMFAFSPENLIALMSEVENDTPLKVAATVKNRKEHVVNLLNIINDRNQIPLNVAAFELGEKAPDLPTFMLDWEKSKMRALKKI
jgi:hypothetical protein